MYRHWESVVEPLLQGLQPDVIVEIGSDQGHNTRNLLEFCRASGAVLHAIDPSPKFDVNEWQRAYPDTLVFHRDVSLESLPTIDQPDVILIDGDHNWYTVFQELAILEKHTGDKPYPVVLLHDIGWPYGRRDLYYEPDRIPEPHRHPNRMAGLRPGRIGLDSSGGLNSHLFNATQEGGPRNGVLTAVEDFLEETDLNLEFLQIPGVNGLGLLLPVGLENHRPDVSGLLGELRNSHALLKLLETVETMRIDALTEAADRRIAQDKDRSLIGKLETELDSLKKAHEKNLSELEYEQNKEMGQLKIRLKALAQERDHLAAQSQRLRVEAASREREVSAKEERMKLLNNRIDRVEQDRSRTLEQLRRLQNRRAVRIALWAAGLAKPTIRLWRRARGGFGRNSIEARPSQAPSTKSTNHGQAVKEPTRRAQPRESEATTADIVVCVHNAGEDVRACLDSIVESTNLVNNGLTLVDDGSDEPARRLLEEFSSRYPARLIRNEEARGYTVAANQGIAASEHPYVVLLNSDTVVGPGWLEKLIHCAETMPDVAVVGPYSNAASWQSVPQLTDPDGTWHLNPLPADTDPRDMAKEVERWSPRLYPEVPLVNGFCYLITRRALDEVGPLDEQSFPRGYGEEDDFSIRCGQHGLRLYVADDCYVYHAKSRSHTPEGRKSIVRENRKKLHDKHGADKIRALVQQIQNDEELVRSRAYVAAALQVSTHPFTEPSYDARDITVGWLQPHLEEAGGIRRAIEMTNRLSRWGCRTVLIVPDGWKTSWLPILSDVVSIERARTMAFDHLIVSDPDMVWPFLELEAKKRTVYHLAPYMLYRRKDETLDEYYGLSGIDILHVSNSRWTAEQVQDYSDIAMRAALPGGVDKRLFHPMRIDRSHDVVCYGSQREHKGTDTIEQACVDMRLLKMQGTRSSQHHLARLINSGLTYVSAAWHEGFNLAALEAMACGVPVVMTDDGGSTEYAVHEENALIVEPRDPAALREQILRVKEDRELRTRLVENGIRTAWDYDWDVTTAEFAALMFD